MRAAWVLIWNALLGVLALLTLPLRLLAAGRRPAHVRYRLHGDPPYHRRQARASLSSRRDPAQVRSLDRLAEELAVLSSDPSVRGVVFELDAVTAAPAKVERVAQLFDSLRGAGKEVVAYAVSASNQEYALMCRASRVVLSPAGRLELVGFAAQPLAIGGLLRRLGVGAHFVRRGDFKTAPELFTREDLSEPQRQTVAAYLDARFEGLLEALCRGRGLGPEEARRRVDGGPYSAKRALQAGLCDALASAADLPALLAGAPLSTEQPPDPDLAARLERREQSRKTARGQKGGGRPRAPMSFAAYNTHRPWPALRLRSPRRPPTLALLELSGMIVPGEGGGGLGRRTSGAEAVTRALRAAGRSARAKALLLYVNSPGGSATASELILDEIERVGRKKPVVAYFDRVAASGGYMAAIGADEIWAGPHAIAGSIGVFAGKFELSALLERVGIRTGLDTRGENAGLHAWSRPFSPSERAALEAEVEETYQAFLEQVARGRAMEVAAVRSRAEGRIYWGMGAVEAGLVDRLGTFEEAAQRALELARVPPGPYRLEVHRPRARWSGLRSSAAAGTRERLWALWEGQEGEGRETWGP